MDYKEKKAQLLELIADISREDVIIAFSGGVDSSVLLKLLCEEQKQIGNRVYALTLHTLLHPTMEAKEAKYLAESMGAEHITVEVNELEEADILQNPVDRCYRCKRCLFAQVLSRAEELGVTHVLEGTNEDDLHVYRPGIKAVKELGLISPLAQCGFTKAEVRRLAEELSISVAQKPSTPCLATRFPYGTTLSYEAMRKVEQGEQFLKERGFYNVRMRVHKDIVRLEIDISSIEEVWKQRDEICGYLKDLGYTYITLDLEGFRSGSMDIHIRTN